MSLFSPITYYLSTSLLPSVSSQLDTLLQMNGATRAFGGVYDKALTHVVAESLKFEGWEQVVRRAEGEGEGEAEEGGDEAGLGQGAGSASEQGTDVHGRRVEVVTPKWVERSAVLGKLQPEQYFSADPSMLFSGICACSTDLPSSDLEVLSAGITALGGQWRISLTKEVTHLFALSPDSPKYSTAIHYKEETGMKVLLPHWFDDVVRLGMRGLSEGVYEWPEPRLLKGVDGFEPPDRDKGKEKEKENVPAKEVQTEKDRVKRNMYATAHLFTQPMNRSSPPTEKDITLVLSASALASAAAGGNNHHNNSNKVLPPSSAPSNGNASILSAIGADGAAPGIQHQVWAGRKVLLSRTLQLYHGRHQAVRLNIERAGGVVLRYEGDDEEPEAVLGSGSGSGSAEGGGGQGFDERLGRKEKARRRREAEVGEECDVLVTRWRYGRAYVQAVRQAKTIGTLAWLFHVQSTGIYTRPLDQLLHFPVPKRPIENFENHVVTVTNYTGEAREYLKKLIMAMGATFTPSMSGQNTALVAAYVHGTKATKALSWSIPVVNHTWLEDCFIQWRNLTPANIKYIHFPPGVDFSKILGERGVHSGGDLTLEGKAKEGVLVNGFKHDINMGGVGASSREEVMGRIEAEAEELAEMGDDLSDVDDEEHEDLEHQAPNGTEASMKEVAGLVDVTIADVDREAPMDLDLEQSPEVSAAAALAVFEHGDGLLDFEDQPPEVSEVDDGAEMEVEVEERVKSPVKPKSTSKSISPTKPKSKSVAVRESPTKPTSKPATSKSPSKPTVNGKISSSAKAKSKPKAISVSGGSSAEDERQPVSGQKVIELADSSEEEEEHVRAKAKEKVKQRMKPKMKPVVEMVVRSTPKGKGKEKEKSAASASASKSKSKSAEKASVRKGATPSEAEDAEAESPSPPLQTVSVRKKNKVTPKSTGKAKEKRSRMTSSSDEANGESDEGMEPPPPRQRKKPVHHEESDEEMKPPPPRQKPRKLVRHVQQDEDEDEDEEGTPPPPPPRRKEKKQNLTKTAKKPGKRVDDETDDEDSVAVVPVKKASVSPAKPVSAATAITSAGKGGLMSKAKGDARTRVKKKNKEKEREVEVESEEEEEPKKKGRKAKEVGRKKGYKEVESEDDEEEDDGVVIVSRKVEKKSTKKGREESAEEEEEAPPPNKKFITKLSKPQPTAKSKSASKSRGEDEPQQAKKGRSKPLRVYSDQDEEDEEEEEEAFPPPADSDDSDELPAAPLQKSKAEKRAEETKKGKGKEKVSTSASKSKAELKTTTSAKGKGKRPATPTETEPDEEQEEEPARTRKATATTATKQGPTTPKRVMSVILPSLELSPEKAKAVKKAMQEVNAQAVEKKKQTETEKGKGKGKVKDKKAVSDDEEQDEEVEEPELPKRKRGGSPKKDKEASTSAPPKSKAQSKSRIVTTSRRHPSSVESEEEEEEVTAIVSPRAARALARTESVRAVAGQAPAATATPSKSAKAKKGAVNGTIVNATASTSRAVVTSVTASTSVKPKPKAKSKREQETPMEVDQSASVSVADDISISVAPPRRSAAAKATQKLHDTIMPDLLQYEAQRKKAGKSASSHAFAMNGDEVDAEKGKKKRASQEEEDGEVEKPKKRRRVSDADSGDEIQVISKPSMSRGKGKQKVNEDDAMDVDGDGKGLPGEGIFIMTTQVSLRDDVVKVLNKLGVKMTTRPNECTHLIASNLVRTEKFLCALASRAPWIITERWAVQSAEAKKILPEKDFVLKDKVGENKYGVVLTESLRRSKALAGKLLAGHTFYVTPRVPVDAKLLKNVVTTCGGQLTTQTPTVRIINAAPTTRHVISCKEDIATWRPLAAQGIKIYTQELVLTGALAQEMHWDREDFLVSN